MDESVREHAIANAPFYITHPGQTDYLFVGVVIFLVVVILFVGNLYFQLHALPERMSHKRSQVQMEIVAVLALIGLFTHNHAFWIGALLLALIDIPNISLPIYSIAESLQKIAGRGGARPRRPAPTHKPAQVAHGEIPGIPAPHLSGDLAPASLLPVAEPK